MTDYRPRETTPRLAEALRRLPVVVLSGLRQCGKSTLLTQDAEVRGRAYHTLDDFAVLAAARRDPEALVESSGAVGAETLGDPAGPLAGVNSRYAASGSTLK